MLATPAITAIISSPQGNMLAKSGAKIQEVAQKRVAKQKQGLNGEFAAVRFMQVNRAARTKT